MPKPADLAVLGLRPPDYFTVTRSLSTLTAPAARNGVLGRVDAHLNEVSVAFPTKRDIRERISMRLRGWLFDRRWLDRGGFDLVAVVDSLAELDFVPAFDFGLYGGRETVFSLFAQYQA
jgi:hypothetical protein